MPYGDPLNPNTPGVSVSPYPPELQQEAAAVGRRRALVDLLLQRALQPIPQPTGWGGIPVPMSPFAAAAPIAGAFLGVHAQNKSDQAATDLAAHYTTGITDARKQIAAEMAKRTPEGFAAASQIAGRWPALKTMEEKLFEQGLPKPQITSQYLPGGGEQRVIADLSAPNAPPAPIGAVKTPPLHPVESVGPDSQPQTSFVNLQDPNLAPVQKPVPLHTVPLGGTTNLVNPYGPERVLPHTLDPNRVPLPEDIEANARMIAEYRMPALTGFAAKAPAGAQIMRRVSEMNPTYDAAVFPVAKQGEINFIEKNGPQIRAFGTLARHVEAAKDLFKSLDNPTDIPRLNQARNFFQQEFGVAAPTQLNLAKQFIADEMAKAVLNGPGALDDRKHFAEALSRSASTAQFEGDLNTTMKFAVEQMKGHEQQYKSMTKSNRKDFQERFLDPQMREIYNRYGGGRRASDQGGGFQLPANVTMDAIDAEIARKKAAGGG